MRYRREFIKRYFKYEIRAYRWISISADERTNMVMEGKIEKDLGYEYKKDGKTYFEYHIDDHNDFQLKCNNLPYGGDYLFVSHQMPSH